MRVGKLADLFLAQVRDPLGDKLRAGELGFFDGPRALALTAPGAFHFQLADIASQAFGFGLQLFDAGFCLVGGGAQRAEHILAARVD